MNDIEKAIEALKMENELMQFDPNTGEDYPIELQNQDNQDLYKANLIAISALEKQVPKKPLEQPYAQEEFDSGTDYLCPNCDSIVGAFSDDMQEWVFLNNHCSDCGQKIRLVGGKNEVSIL